MAHCPYPEHELLSHIATGTAHSSTTERPVKLSYEALGILNNPQLVQPHHPTPYNASTRYRTCSFRLPRPQLIAPAASAYTAHTILENTNAAKADTLWREALSPLPPTKQRQGFKIGFFEQGIITGRLLTLASLVATVSTLGYYAWAYVRVSG